MSDQSPPSEHDQLVWFVEYLDEHGDPRTLRAELAELRAQVRYLADDVAARDGSKMWTEWIEERLRGLVGDWPREAAAGSEEA